jgi:sec-independent protein translocase protein TatA
MFGLGMMELGIIAAILLLLFGSKRIADMGPSLGKAIRGFRKEVSRDSREEKDKTDI